MSKELKPIYVPTVVRAYAQVFIGSDVCSQNQAYLKMRNRKSKKQKKGIGIMVSVPLVWRCCCVFLQVWDNGSQDTMMKQNRKGSQGFLKPTPKQGCRTKLLTHLRYQVQQSIGIKVLLLDFAKGQNLWTLMSGFFFPFIFISWRLITLQYCSVSFFFF